MGAILQVDQVYKYFGGVKANENISMTVTQGSIAGLIGPNGSGKTTLFNSIVGTHPIDKGSIKFEDKEENSKKSHFEISLPYVTNFDHFLRSKKT